MVLSSMERSASPSFRSVVLAVLSLLGLAQHDDMDEVLEEMFADPGFQMEDCAGGECSVNLMQTSALFHRRIARHDFASGKAGLEDRGKTLMKASRPLPPVSSDSHPDLMAPSFFQLGSATNSESNATDVTEKFNATGFADNRSAQSTFATELAESKEAWGSPEGDMVGHAWGSSEGDESAEVRAPSLYGHHERSLPSKHHAMILAVLLILLFVLLGIASAVLWRALHVRKRVKALVVWKWRVRNDPIREYVEALTPCRGSEVDRQLPANSGYDCALSRPVSSKQPLRLQARVVGPVAGGSPLTAPLSQQACVRYVASVSEPAPDSAHLEQVASFTESISFVVSLADMPATQIEVCGKEVLLFDVRGGHLVERRCFESALEHWQDFTLFHRTVKPMRSEQAKTPKSQHGSELKFEESALLVGSDVTMVGELLRHANGKLSLQPWPGQMWHASMKGDKREVCRTHLDAHSTCETKANTRDLLEAGLIVKPHPEGRVLVSDNPQLLQDHTAASDAASDLGMLPRLWSLFGGAASKAALVASTRITAASMWGALQCRPGQESLKERAIVEDKLASMYI